MAEKKVKTVWVTEDGVEFNSEEMAVAHEKREEMKNFLKIVLEDVPIRFDEVGSVIDALMEAPRLYMTILPGSSAPAEDDIPF